MGWEGKLRDEKKGAPGEGRLWYGRVGGLLEGAGVGSCGDVEVRVKGRLSIYNGIKEDLTEMSVRNSWKSGSRKHPCLPVILSPLK